MKHRRDKVWLNLASYEVDGFLTFSPENRRYMTGFSGSSGYVVVTAQETLLLTDSRYAEQSAHEAKESTVHLHAAKWMTSLADYIADKKIRRLGFEPESVSFATYQQLAKAIPHVVLVPVENVIENVRMVKEDSEIATMKIAAEIADAAFTHVTQWLQKGVTERDVALELLVFMQKQGATGISFDTIVASGERSSMPHGVASDRVIQTGDLITLDFGARYNGYASDMTRTVGIGEVSSRQREIYDVVYKAQTTALSAIHAGMTGQEADTVARDVIVHAGYGENFGHSLGHGLGLAVHEAPRLAQQSQDVLQEGMVVTVEPGVYVSGFCGVRIEDDIVVTKNGSYCLTQSTKDLLIL